MEILIGILCVTIIAFLVAVPVVASMLSSSISKEENQNTAEIARD